MASSRGHHEKPLTQEEVEKCRVLIKEGKTWKEIAARLKRPQTSIYHHYTQADKDYVPRRKATKRSEPKEMEYGDISKLPNEVLFDFKDFVIF